MGPDLKSYLIALSRLSSMGEIEFRYSRRQGSHRSGDLVGIEDVQPHMFTFDDRERIWRWSPELRVSVEVPY